MATKVLPAVKRLTEEDIDKENVSTARTLDSGQDEKIDELQIRLGRLLGRLAARTALSPERAANIWKRVRESAHK